MIEKVNPKHPDKVADRIAGAIVDLAYEKEEDPKIAVEVLVGHDMCHIIAETSVLLHEYLIQDIVERIAGKNVTTDFVSVHQDRKLAKNQSDIVRCGDNGIFKGIPLTFEQKTLSQIARHLYKNFGYDGKYILDGENNKLIICQSNATNEDIEKCLDAIKIDKIINPLGFWTGGTNVDTGATNRKLGSDMADSITGGGLHGKDLSKVDVSVNIYAFLKAQRTKLPVELCCAIGDEYIDGKPYSEIVSIAKQFIIAIGGFEKFAEWGLY